MNSTNKTVVKNFVALLMAQPLTWLLTLTVTFTLPRYLGASALGQLGIATSLWAIFSVFMAFGMDAFLAKEIARHPQRAGELLATSLLMRVLLYLMSCVVASIYVTVMNFSGEMIALVFIAGISQLFWTSNSGVEATVQGLETMQYISIVTVTVKLLNTILMLGAVFLGLNIYAIASVGVISSITAILLLVFFLVRHHKLSLRPRPELIPFIWRSSTPYLFSALGIGMYKQIDVQVMGALVNSTIVGWYNAALALYATFFFVPITIATAVFPMLSRSSLQDPQAAQQMLRKVVNLVFVVSLPISLGTLAVASPFVLLLYGEDFAPAGTVLMVMSVVMLFSHQNVLIGKYLYAVDRQRMWAAILVTASVFTLPLDLLLVPWCQRLFGNGALGGSLSYLITELSMFIIGLRLIPRGTLGWSTFWPAARALGAGLIMFAVVWSVRDLFILIPVLTGAAVYIPLALLMRVVPAEDLRILRQTLLNGATRIRRRVSARMSPKGA